jgi:hypothetical protein
MIAACSFASSYVPFDGYMLSETTLPYIEGLLVCTNNAKTAAGVQRR